MLGDGGGSSATLPSKSVQRDWMASILLGGASWMTAMAAVSLVEASMIPFVAAISGTGMAWNMSVFLLPPVSAMRTQMQR
jgi:hypothetical protein